MKRVAGMISATPCLFVLLVCAAGSASNADVQILSPGPSADVSAGLPADVHEAFQKAFAGELGEGEPDGEPEGEAVELSVRIRVVQPGTNRLVSKAEVSIFATGNLSVCIRRGVTGLSGEPYQAEEEEELDPSLKELVVVAEKGGRSGSTRIHYDRQLGAWLEPFIYEYDHEKGDWRRVVYEPVTDTWELLVYDGQSGSWKMQGRYQRFAVNDEDYWCLRMYDYQTGKWWTRIFYEEESLYDRGDSDWIMSRMYDPLKGWRPSEMIEKEEKENWRLPAGISGPQPIRVLVR